VIEFARTIFIVKFHILVYPKKKSDEEFAHEALIKVIACIQVRFQGYKSSVSLQSPLLHIARVYQFPIFHTNIHEEIKNI